MEDEIKVSFIPVRVVGNKGKPKKIKFIKKSEVLVGNKYILILKKDWDKILNKYL